MIIYMMIIQPKYLIKTIQLNKLIEIIVKINFTKILKIEKVQ